MGKEKQGRGGKCFLEKNKEIKNNKGKLNDKKSKGIKNNNKQGENGR